LREAWIDDHVVNQDLIGSGAEQRSQFLVDAFDLELFRAAFDAVSLVAIAVIAADLVSATNRMPSGPNASGPIDLNSAFPCFMPLARSAA
jgi:hypothetical protein